MNLENLISKLKNIDEGVVTIGGPAHAEQPSTVTMNVSMNGSGADGIKSLMAVLRDIEHAEAGPMNSEPHHAQTQGGEEEPLIGDMVHSMEQEMTGQDSPLTTAPEEEMAEEMGDDNESWGNSAEGSSGHHTHGIDAVTFSGDDMNSKAKVSPLARAPGTNPLRHPMHEEVASRLQSLYDSIKEERTEEKDEPPFDPPYRKARGDVVDKSGAKHTGHSHAKHLAQQGMKKNTEKSEKDVEEDIAGNLAPIANQVGQVVGKGVKNAEYNLTHPGEFVGNLAHNAGQAVGKVVHGAQAGYDTVKQGVQNVANQAVQGYEQGAHPDSVAVGQTPAHGVARQRKPATVKPTPATQTHEDFELEEMLKIAGLR